MLVDHDIRELTHIAGISKLYQKHPALSQKYSCKTRNNENHTEFHVLGAIYILRHARGVGSFEFCDKV